MHRHDLDLIAAYAEGSAGDDTEARALVEACAECRAEYQAQRQALSFLGSLPAVSPMTDIEKAGMHRDLWTTLRNPATAAKGSARWMKWSLAAAGLFVVVGLAGVLGPMMGAEDQGGGVEALVATTSGNDTVRESAEEPMAPAAGDGSASATTIAGDSGELFYSTTTAAAAETTAGPATDADFEAVAADARAAEIDTPTTTSADEEEARCAADDRLGAQRVLTTVELDRTYLLTVPAGAQLTAETPITFVDADTCEVVRVVE
jgi:hypothetical protein